MFFHDIHDWFQILFGHHGSRRIVGERQNQNLCLIGDGCAKLLRRELKRIFFFQFYGHRNPVGQLNTRQIGNITRFRQDHFISGIQHGPKRQINTFTAANGDKDLMNRIILKLQFPFQITGDGCPQLHESGVGSIECSALFQRENALLPDVPRRIKVRLSHTERNGIRHLLYQVEELPDTGRLNLYNFIGKWISHGVTFILLLSSFSISIIP